MIHKNPQMIFLRLFADFLIMSFFTSIQVVLGYLLMAVGWSRLAWVREFENVRNVIYTKEYEKISHIILRKTRIWVYNIKQIEMNGDRDYALSVQCKKF